MTVFRSTKGASKQRRDLINAEITRLRDLLPISEGSRNRLGQLQVMSIANIFIRKSNYLARLFEGPGCNLDAPFEFTQALSGFLLVVTRDGKLLYVSENVTEYLGHSMVDLLTQGDSLYDIIDKRDHASVQSRLLQDSEATRSSDQCSFFCRMNISRALRRQCGYGDHKVMHVKGRFIQPVICDQFGNQPVLIATCSPLITRELKESTIPNTMTFQSIHGLDMKYIEIATNGEFHLGYSNEEIVGKSWYSLLHPEDLAEAKEKHMQLVKSCHEVGCSLTVRLNSKDGCWVWCSVVMHISQPFAAESDPAIVCVNQIISESDAENFKLQSQLHTSHIASSPEYLKPPQNGSRPHTITSVLLDTGHPSPASPYSPPTRGSSSHVASFSPSQVNVGRSSSTRPTAAVHSDSKPYMSTQLHNAPNEVVRSSTKESTKQLILNQLKRKLRSSLDSAARSPPDNELLSKPAKIPRTVIEVETFDSNLAETVFSIPVQKVEPLIPDVEVNCQVLSSVYNTLPADMLEVSLKKDLFDLDLLEDQVFNHLDVADMSAFTNEIIPSDEIIPTDESEELKSIPLQQELTNLSMQLIESSATVPLCTLTPESSPAPLSTETMRSCTPDQTVPVTDTVYRFPDSPESIASPVPHQNKESSPSLVPEIRLEESAVIKRLRQLPELDTQYVDNFFDRIFDEQKPQTLTHTQHNNSGSNCQTGCNYGRLPHVPENPQNSMVAMEPEVLCASHEEVTICSEDQFMALLKTVKELMPSNSGNLATGMQQHQPDTIPFCVDECSQNSDCPADVVNGGFMFFTEVQMKEVQEILGGTIQPPVALDFLGNAENGSFDQCTL